MTLSTWKTEFYPTEASECSKEDAIEHSLRKWRGLRASELKRHEVRCDRGHVVGDGKGVFWVTSGSCALCEHFLGSAGPAFCTRCPLAKSRGGWPCDVQVTTEAMAPWHHWTRNSDPEPMIAALEKAQKEQP